MRKALLFQGLALVLVCLAAIGLSGWWAAYSAFVGGMACLVPSALFALRLKMVSQRQAGTYVTNFFLGEFLKVAATVGILLVVVRVYPDIHWLAMLVGLAATLHAGFFAFWKKS